MAGGYLYILASRRNTVLYVGVTSDLAKRIGEHKAKTFGGFTAKYCVDKLVYYERFDTIEGAIRREKQLKAGSRDRKVRLIMSVNPGWVELEV